MNSLICALAIPMVTAQSPDAPYAHFDEALASAGLSVATARFDENLLRFFRQGHFTTPLYEACSENPWRIPYYVETIQSEVRAASGTPSDLIATGGRLLGVGSRRTLLGDPNAADAEAAQKPGALKATLEAMKSAGFMSGAIPSLESVPAPVQSGASLILRVMMRVKPLYDGAFSAVKDRAAFESALARGASDSGQLPALLADYRALDLRLLFAGAHDLVRAAQTAEVWCRGMTDKYDVRIQTQWGLIRLCGGSNEQHGPAPTLLLIDTSGDDQYVGVPSSIGSRNWASIVIDTEGSDKYLSHPDLAGTEIEKWSGRRGTEGSGPASAMAGYTVLIDSRGKDLYRSHLPGLGSATGGAAVLLDREGDDEYDSYRNAIGYGNFGIGIVEDLAGTDLYKGFNQVQGMGQTMGFGLLADRKGNDTYVANDSTIDIPSPQSAEHNVSMAQGAGNGRRGDYLEGHSLAGGVGMLVDDEGDDRYSAGVFGQGVGYWEGVGLLLDAAGNDSYHGQWYVQAASAHFAIGILEDGGGNDHYNALMNMAQGAGHDFSVGFLIERGGNDVYRAPNLSLGGGNANGIGVLLELGGNDSYTSSGITLGKAADAPAGSLRQRALCLGLFLDLGGEDSYPESAAWAINGSSAVNWTRRAQPASESQVGIFFDR